MQQRRDCTIRISQRVNVVVSWQPAKGVLYKLVYRLTENCLRQGSVNRAVRVWKLNDGRTALAGQHSDGVQAVAIVPTGDRVVSVDSGGVARIWRIPTVFTNPQKCEASTLIPGTSGI